MTRDETKGIIRMLMGAYPNFKAEDLKSLISTWFFYLEEYELPDVLLAMKSFSKSGKGKGFAPAPDDLIDQIHKMRELQKNDPNELQAWSLVSNAIRKSSYYAEEEFEKLPEAVQKAVGSPSMLRNWATTDINTLENVVASNFQRTYRSVLAREKEISRMPKMTKGLEMAVVNLLEVKNGE